MNIHEYQAKEVLRSYGVPTPRGVLIHSPEEARQAARSLGTPICAVKAQIHAGGRGAGHFRDHPEIRGVRIVKSPEEAKEAAYQMLNQTLITRQTGPAGRVVHKLYVEAGCAIERELYLSMLIDRSTRKIMVVASQAGGMSIEDVAEKTPEKIQKIWIDPELGLGDYQARVLATRLALQGQQINELASIIRSVYSAFTSLDTSMIEMNPLVVTKEGSLMALDAKMSFDDNGLFRHPQIAELRDPNEEDPREQEAARFGLSYVSLDGTIGCMVNGAGLAMATMDIIHEEGESPANFLDVGGGASREKVGAAFRILLSDQKIEGVLVNIFGGIMRCDLIAGAVIDACRQEGLKVPLVIRLAGTLVEEGLAMIRQSGLDITIATDLGDAARKIVAEVRARRAA
ncbi:ADP-forming succinate--CoA ligase subunit beta [Acetobacter sp.]|jgi:succinyl-CoA synthetase beta subunit|uniref:ADP-forming succinate--CoA ligase subunit beta n=1 Tax=Acetobacter sp. TaxID=440 RepID=UPI0025C07558|nr:ADP-forming succinate--CoA ligase subunit beta [Acetobacter sp.]MCH4090395.1 ADP-forming succinate--CoA ligase subunit beta [Acetobacter sp.]MCI1299089.1 ADP-forming succinate--CoA ligase subunit beta [Acetobacter sp.]MCI1315636.1 ADP-forming succinate--CoA ligase subunit beta [Acetobacter sp.]